MCIRKVHLLHSFVVEIRNISFASLTWNTDGENAQQFVVINHRGDIVQYVYSFAQATEPQLDIHCVNQWGSAAVLSLFTSNEGTCKE